MADHSDPTGFMPQRGLRLDAPPIPQNGPHFAEDFRLAALEIEQVELGQMNSSHWSPDVRPNVSEAQLDAADAYRAQVTGVDVQPDGSTMTYRVPYKPILPGELTVIVDFCSFVKVNGNEVYIQTVHGNRRDLFDAPFPNSRQVVLHEYLLTIRRQVRCLRQHGLTPGIDCRIEWKCSDADVAKALSTLASEHRLPIRVFFQPGGE